MPLHHQMASEMLFQPYPHAAAGDHMARAPAAHYPGYMPAPHHWAQAGTPQAHGADMPGRFMVGAHPLMNHPWTQMQMQAQAAMAAQHQQVCVHYS